MKSSFAYYLPHLLRHEGGYVDHPADPGGATNMGITLATLSAWRRRPVSKAAVRALTRDEAASIYRVNYWNVLRADDLSPGVDIAAFDIAVNSGPARARQWLPLTVGKSAPDGVKALCARRRAFFRSLKTFAVFGKGWMRRVNEVEALAFAWAVKYTVGGNMVTERMADEARAANASAKKSGAGAVVIGSTGGTAGAGAVASPEIAAQVDWVALLAIGAPLLLIIGLLIRHAVMQADRAKAFSVVTPLPVEGEAHGG